MIDRSWSPTIEDREEFWIRAYLRPEPDWLEACLRAAYGDMARRTLKGIAKLPNRDALTDDARQKLKQRIQDLRRNLPVDDQRAFDDWHEKTCGILLDLYASGGYLDDGGQPKFTVGQAQKWINMTFKYTYLAGNRLPDYREIYDLCHMPIDNVILEAMSPFNPPDLGGPWSRVTDYHGRYMGFQEWVRQEFAVPPLAVEFFAYMGRDVRRFLRNEPGARP